MQILPNVNVYTAAAAGASSAQQRDRASDSGFQPLDGSLRRVRKADVAAAGKPRVPAGDEAAEQRSRFLREAPTGGRPRYVAKGQAVDLTV